MAEIERIILDEVQEDGVDTAALVVEVRRAKGLFNRRKVIALSGHVKHERDKQKVISVAEHHAGDNYDVRDDITVTEGD